jgi:hypothetical protein
MTFQTCKLHAFGLWQHLMHLPAALKSSFRLRQILRRKQLEVPLQLVAEKKSIDFAVKGIGQEDGVGQASKSQNLEQSERWAKAVDVIVSRSGCRIWMEHSLMISS